MVYVSDLIGKPVVDATGKRVGSLDDVVASVRGEMRHPEVVAVVIRRRPEPLIIPIAEVSPLGDRPLVIRRELDKITPYVSSHQDLYLARDVLDKQIIDTNGVRVVRVNDLELTAVNSHYYLANVDISTLGLLRRLGLARTAQRLASGLGRGMQDNMISWDAVESLPGDQPMRLKVPGEKITELHPADLAEIISDLSRAESDKLVQSLDLKTLADALEEVEPEFQASLVEKMPDEKVADVLEEMAPDEAADLLAELPEFRSKEILRLMEDEEAEDVRKLLMYPEDSAGGIMNTEFVAMRPDLTAERAIEELRETAEEAETVFYVYVTDEQEHLLGVFSLRQLVLAKPTTPLSELMERRIVSVKPSASQDEVAQTVAKYNLLAVPVVDNENRLLGIVTADDALDKIIPTAWKKRLPRLYH